jgi:hypothetical protein
MLLAAPADRQLMAVGILRGDRAYGVRAFVLT